MANKVDVAVIGAGPAGLAAAIAAREQGAEKVLIIERAEQLGGLLPQCIHNGFGLEYFERDMTGPEYEKAFVERAMGLGVETQLETMVIDLDGERGITAVSRKHGYMKFKPGAVVLAMGCRERSRGAVGIPGTRPAGVLTAGTCQRFVNIEGYMPGSRYVVLGSGDIGMIMARRLTLEGAKVEAVVEIMPWPGGLIRNEVQCLHDFGIPLLLEHTVSFVHGEKRVEGVSVCRVDAERRPIGGSERFIPCDCLLISAGLIPENELTRDAGVGMDPVTGGAVVDDSFMTSVPGIFACGNVLHVHDLVDWVSVEAAEAGKFAACFVREGSCALPSPIPVRPGSGVRYTLPQAVSGERDLTLSLRVSAPWRDRCVVVRDGGREIARKREMRLHPAEMIRIDLKKETVSGCSSLEVTVE